MSLVRLGLKKSILASCSLVGGVQALIYSIMYVKAYLSNQIEVKVHSCSCWKAFEEGGDLKSICTAHCMFCWVQDVYHHQRINVQQKRSFNGAGTHGDSLWWCYEITHELFSQWQCSSRSKSSSKTCSRDITTPNRKGLSWLDVILFRDQITRLDTPFWSVNSVWALKLKDT